MNWALGMGRSSLESLNTEDVEGGLLFWDPVGYERKVLGPGICLLGGSAGQPGVGSSTGGFERLLKGAL